MGGFKDSSNDLLHLLNNSNSNSGNNNSNNSYMNSNHHSNRRPVYTSSLSSSSVNGQTTAASSSTTNIGNHHTTLHHIHHTRQRSNSLGDDQRELMTSNQGSYKDKDREREREKEKIRRGSGGFFQPPSSIPTIPSAGDLGSLVSGAVGNRSALLPSTTVTVTAPPSGSSNSGGINGNDVGASIGTEECITSCDASQSNCQPTTSLFSDICCLNNQQQQPKTPQQRRFAMISVIVVSVALISALIYLYATDFAGSYYYHHIVYHNQHNGMISSKGQHYYYNRHYYQHHLRPLSLSSPWALPLNVSSLGSGITGSSSGSGSSGNGPSNSGSLPYSLSNWRQAGSSQQRYYYLISSPTNGNDNSNSPAKGPSTTNGNGKSMTTGQQYQNEGAFSSSSTSKSLAQQSPSSSSETTSSNSGSFPTSGNNAGSTWTSNGASNSGGSSASTNGYFSGHDILRQIKLQSRSNYSILFPHQQEKILVYLAALFNGVKILEAPVTNTLLNAIYDCERDSKPSLLYNQHALEVRFPTVLSDMDQLAKRDDILSIMNYASSIGNNGDRSGGAGSKMNNDITDALYQSMNTRAFFKINHDEKRHEEPISGFSSTAGNGGASSGSVSVGNAAISSSNSRDHIMHKLLSHAVFRAPLFYYLNSAFYTVVYCSYTPRRKEDWRSGLEYLKEIAVDITKSSTWKANHGMDFVVPASHPKSGPNTFDPASINEFSRASYLRTDFDFHGNSPKDIVVPYYTKPTHWDVIYKLKNESAFAIKEDQSVVIALAKKKLATSTTSTKVTTAVPGLLEDPSGKRETVLPKADNVGEDRLLVFIGSDNPVGGLRYQLHQAFAKLAYPDIFFTVTDYIPSNAYKSYLIHSEFCLSIRGDTASASRLFSIISLGTCIPVIISDWLPLPFESIIDYSKFTLRFPESIVNHPEDLVTFLRSVSHQQRNQLRQGIREARDMLLYEQAENEVTLLNPISLTLIEMLQRREKYCKQLGIASKMSAMCEKIKRRMYLAQQAVSALSTTTSSTS